jgi:hypothetical protein
MSDYVWAAFVAVVWFCSNLGYLALVMAASFAAAGWFIACERRAKRREADRLAAETAKRGDERAANLDAVARLHTDLHYGTGVVPAVGSDPWLADLLALELNEEGAA